MNGKLRVLRRDYDLKKEPYGFGATDGGLYCMTPYSLNQDGVGLFKVGMASNFVRRFESYFTSHPTGVWYVAFLRPDYSLAGKIERGQDVNTRSRANEAKINLTIKNGYFRYLEKLLIQKLLARPDVRPYHSNVRTKATEWFLCKPSAIHEVFMSLGERFTNPQLKSNKVLLHRLTKKEYDDYQAEIIKTFKNFIKTEVIFGFDMTKEQEREWKDKTGRTDYERQKRRREGAEEPNKRQRKEEPKKKDTLKPIIETRGMKTKRFSLDAEQSTKRARTGN